jgi:hypothetical protein
LTTAQSSLFWVAHGRLVQPIGDSERAAAPNVRARLERPGDAELQCASESASRACGMAWHGMQQRSRRTVPTRCAAARTYASTHALTQAAHAQDTHTHAQDTHKHAHTLARARPRHTGLAARAIRLCSGGRAGGRVHRSGHAAIAHERVRLAGRVVASGTLRRLRRQRLRLQRLRPLRFRFYRCSAARAHRMRGASARIGIARGLRCSGSYAERRRRHSGRSRSVRPAVRSPLNPLNPPNPLAL